MVRLLVILLIFTISSCSQKKESSVRLEISNNFIFGGPETSGIAGGGLMVWGKSSKGGSFARAIENGDVISLQLMNDNWIFWAMAWDGSYDYIANANNLSNDTPFGGKIKCARSAPVTLSGGDAAVTLSLTNAQCDLPAFRGNLSTTLSGGILSIPKLRLRFCDSIDGVKSPIDRCTDKMDDLNRKARKAPVNSYRVVLKNHKSLGPLHGLQPGGIIGPCVPFIGRSAESTDQSGTSSLDFPSLPVGGVDLPFHTLIEVFVGNDNCDLGIDRKGPIVIHMPNGVSSPSPGHNYIQDIADNLHVTAIKIAPPMVCEGRRGTGMGVHPFAGGMGSSLNPYIICSAPQLFAINESATNLTRSYKLQDHIDLSPFVKGSSLAGTPVRHSCLDWGDNFIPLGFPGDSTTCNTSTGVMLWSAPVPFTGKFVGSGHKISNLRFHNKKLSKVGLFSYLNIFANVSEIDLIRPEIEGQCEVGALAGLAVGSSAPSDVSMTGIKVINGNILSGETDTTVCGSNSQAGGIIGQMNKAALVRSFVIDSRVKGFMDQVGGAVGMTLNSQLNRVSVEADVSSIPMMSDSSFVGGVVGVATNTDIDYVKHEGEVRSNGYYIGGIAGEIDTAATRKFTNFYAISSVVNEIPAGNSFTGGVVGNWKNGTLTTELGPGYSLSMVRTNCVSAPANTCWGGPFKGGANPGLGSPTTPGPLYKLNSSIQHLSSNILGGAGGSGELNFNGESTTVTYDDFRKNSTGITGLPTAGEDDWIHVVGSYPRFDFENHPCSVAGASLSGDGTPEKPIAICNRVQFTQLGMGANDGKYYKLLSSIRLTNYSPSLDHEFPTMNTHLLGNNKALIGGSRAYTGTASTGYIGVLNGSIKDLRVLGMFRSRINPASTPTDMAGILVADNKGILENINVSAFASFQDYGAGLVGKNSAEGVIKNVSLNLRLFGQQHLAGLALQNDGLIEDSKIHGLLMINSSPSDDISGLVKTNSAMGIIQRTEMGLSLDGTIPSLASQISMLVDNNAGLIEDVLIPRQVEFKLPGGGNHYYFTRENAADAVVSRVLNLGKLLVKDKQSATDMALWPTSNNPSLSGTYTDVYRAGRSGKLLLAQADYVCSDNSTLYIGAWFNSGSPNFIDDWNAFSFSTYSSISLVENKKAVVEFTTNSGPITAQVISMNVGARQFVIAPGLCGTTGATGKVDLYWTNDIPVQPGTSTAAAGVMLPQLAQSKANYSGTWQDTNVMWDLNDPADRAAMMSYKSYPLVAPKAPWILLNGELQLFK